MGFNSGFKGLIHCDPLKLRELLAAQYVTSRKNWSFKCL